MYDDFGRDNIGLVDTQSAGARRHGWVKRS